MWQVGALCPRGLCNISLAATSKTLQERFCTVVTVQWLSLDGSKAAPSGNVGRAAKIKVAKVLYILIMDDVETK